MHSTAERCVLAHRGFLVLGDVVFQRSETDGVPIALVPLGDSLGAVPLRALQHELAIADDSDDGRMLALIAEALDFVVTLRQGDPLPAEVLTGEASWEPLPRHLESARKRLRDAVLQWTVASGGAADFAMSLAVLAPLIAVADAAAVAAALESLAFELAFIEASRETLLERVRGLGRRLDRLRFDGGSGAQRDELMQTRRLADTAAARIAARFVDVEAQTTDIVSALRRAEGVRCYVRSNRDWLHRSGLAWERVLQGWDHEAAMKPRARRALVALTYRFLAQRFMSVREWRGAERRAGATPVVPMFEW